MKIIIKKLEVTSFGCLKNKVFTPNEGMNQIIAPNESGKSTLAAFIKFIFYGFGSSKKDIMDSDRKMYLPWDTSVACGAAEITADGELYRIERKFAPSQKEQITITELSSGKNVFTGLCPGEVFFKTSVETAEKTFIFDQYCALTARDSELFDSIRNMIFQGDETGKSEVAIKRLKEAKKELKNTRGGGLIENLEKELEKYKAAYDISMGKLSTLKEINQQITAFEKSFERNSIDEKKLLEEKENVEKYQALLKLKELNELEKEATNAENAYRIAVSSLEGAGIPDTELLEMLVNANTEKLSLASKKEELLTALKKSEDELKTLSEKEIKSQSSTEEIKKNLSGFGKKIKSLYLFAGISGIIGVAIAFVNTLLCAILLSISAVLSFFAITNNSKKTKYIKTFNTETEPELLALLSRREETAKLISEKETEIKNTKERISVIETKKSEVEETLSSVFGRYFKDTNEDSAELIRKLRTVSQKVAEAKKTAVSKRESLLKTAELLDKSALEKKSFGAVMPSRSMEEIERQLRFVQSGNKHLEDKIVSAEKEKAVIESSINPPSVLLEKAQAVATKLDAAKKRFASITIALELIEKAGDEMKATLAPKITSYASELFNIATDGKYKALNVTTELSLSTDNGETVKSAEYLSAGARATAYICLRIALMKAVYKDTFPPIIFDDAFVRLDKKRLEQIHKALMSSPAKDTQIFIFSANEE